MTVGEAISRIQSLYSKGVESDDSRLSSRHIYNKWMTVRQQLAIDQFRKGIRWSDWDQQPLSYIPMMRYQAWGCSLMRSKEKLPKAVSDGMDEGITVTDATGSAIYTRTTFEHKKYITGNKYTSKRLYYFISDDYLYLLNSRMDTAFCDGVWRDPISTYRLDQHFQGTPYCGSNRDIDTFTPGDILEMTIQISSSELIQQFSQMREDVRNNMADTPPEEGK